MRRLVFSILIAIIFTLPAMAQVDSLMLSEIGSIQGPAAITGFYAVNLQGDSSKELIITIANNVYVYDSQSRRLLWTSPPVSNPRDMAFYDLDSDSHPDIAFRDSLNLYVYSGSDFQQLWMSPPIDSTFSCFTVGDYNDDNNADILLVIKEPFLRIGDRNNRDTIWVNLFDGPDFHSSGSFITLMTNYAVSYPFYGEGHESPLRILVMKLSSADSIQTRIFLFSNYEDSGIGTMGSWGWTKTGNVFLIRPADSSYIKINNLGKLLFCNSYYQDGLVHLFTIGQSSWGSGGPFGGGYNITKHLRRISADSLIFGDTLWQANNSYYLPSDWGGFSVGEITQSNPGDEFCYTNGGVTKLYGFPNLNLLWSVSTSSAYIFKIYHNSLLFNGPQIMCRTLDRLYDGTNGNLTAAILNSGIVLNDVADLDNNGEDELLSYSGDTLNIYHFNLYCTGTNDDANSLPASFRLYANYPNPFNTSTVIKYDLLAKADVTLEIYDILGRKVATLANENQEAGSHQVSWDGSKATSGIYFYKLQADEFYESKRMLLVK